LPSDRVTVIAGPAGRQPWLTKAWHPTGPASSAPTAPRSRTVWSSSSRAEPRPRDPPATPPTNGSPASASLDRARNPSTGNDQGSARSTATASSGIRSGIPTTAMPDSAGITSRWNARIRTPGSTPHQTATALAASTARPEPMTPPALQPSVVPAPTSSAARWAAAVTSPGSAPQTKIAARSGGWPCSGVTASVAARPAAARRSASATIACPNRAT